MNKKVGILGGITTSDVEVLEKGSTTPTVLNFDFSLTDDERKEIADKIIAGEYELKVKLSSTKEVRLRWLKASKIRL